MADQSPIHFEDIPLNQARRMGRGSRMEPLLYDTLRKKIQALTTDATRIHLGPEITQQRMRNYILRVARDLNIPITVRRVPGGVLFWHSSDEDRQQAQEVGKHLQRMRHKRSQARGGRRRTWVVPRHSAQLTIGTSDEETRKVFATATREDVKGVEEQLTARLDRIENLILTDYGQRIETLEKQVKKLLDALAV